VWKAAYNSGGGGTTVTYARAGRITQGKLSRLTFPGRQLIAILHQAAFMCAAYEIAPYLTYAIFVYSLYIF
jgi:hypothetical protein